MLRSASEGLGKRLDVSSPGVEYFVFAMPHAHDFGFGHQAVVDDDGVFRCVISHRDPGVYNWLDTGGYSWGTLNGRWLLTDAWPEPEMRVVPFDEIGKHVRAQTRRVTPNERSELLRCRARAAQHLNGF